MKKHQYWQLITLISMVGLIFSACSINQRSGEKTIPEVPLMEGSNPLPQLTAESQSQDQAELEEGKVEMQPDADVLFVEAEFNGQTWTFRVTVSHPDTSWEDYADGWDVVLPDGTVLKANPADPFTRLLLHPHENEQPFTRSQSGLIIPDGIDLVTVRAHDLVDGFGGQEITLDMTASSGENYQIIRPEN